MPKDLLRKQCLADSVINMFSPTPMKVHRNESSWYSAVRKQSCGCSSRDGNAQVLESFMHMFSNLVGGGILALRVSEMRLTVRLTTEKYAVCSAHTAQDCTNQI